LRATTKTNPERAVPGDEGTNDSAARYEFRKFDFEHNAILMKLDRLKEKFANAVHEIRREIRELKA
jgi:hypothetical protein